MWLDTLKKINIVWNDFLRHTHIVIYCNFPLFLLFTGKLKSPSTWCCFSSYRIEHEYGSHVSKISRVVSKSASVASAYHPCFTRQILGFDSQEVGGTQKKKSSVPGFQRAILSLMRTIGSCFDVSFLKGNTVIPTTNCDAVSCRPQFFWYITLQFLGNITIWN